MWDWYHYWYWCHLGVFFVLSLMVCLRGFYKQKHFVGAGYGFSVAIIGAAMAFFTWYGIYPCITIAHYIQYALFIVYGLRLAFFLLAQEKRDAKEREAKKQEPAEEKKWNIFAKIAVWLLMCAFYVAQTTGVAFRLFNAWGTTIYQWIGIAISVVGILVETICDLVKRSKIAKNPDAAEIAPLYGFVRYPNYFGKILFWTGVLVSGLDAVIDIGQWLAIILVYVAVLVIAIIGAKKEKELVAQVNTAEEAEN